MHYVIADVHGCYDLFLKLLEKIGFSDSDTLYLLGDMIDRGPDGIKVLQDVMRRKNVVPFLGNHEHMFYEILRSIGKELTPEEQKEVGYKMVSWTLLNGGEVTWDAYCALSEAEKREIAAYLETLSVYEEVDVGEESFLLVHAGLGAYAPDKDPWDCSLKELIWDRVDYDKVYDPYRYLVTGHTPTALIDPDCRGRFFRKNNHIAIDCGAFFTGVLGCLCLETLEEICVSQQPGREE